MENLISSETLSYYLSKKGFMKFKPWYITIECLEPIYDDLDKLTNQIQYSTWLDDNLREECFDKIRILIVKQIVFSIGKEPDIVFQEWIDSIQQYCFQGGYGHRIQYTGNAPHHWCVKCEHYEKVKTISNTVVLCGLLSEKYVYLSNTADYMIWG